MTFSTKILIGLAAGIVTGLFLGERAAALDWVADGFVKLLQMTVLPYVTVSIVSSLGALDYASAKALGLRVGAVIAGLWLVALLVRLSDPAGLSDGRERVVLQHGAGAAPAGVRLRRSLHPLQPVQLAGQQRRAGGGAVLGAGGRGAHRRRAPAGAARRAPGGQRHGVAGHAVRRRGSPPTACSPSRRPRPGRSTSNSSAGSRSTS